MPPHLLLFAALCVGLGAQAGATVPAKAGFPIKPTDAFAAWNGEKMFINLDDTNSTDEPVIHVPGGKWEDHSYKHAARTLWNYQEENPEFAEGVMIFWFTGMSLMLIGIILIVYSEVTTVLVCRDQDFRRKLMDKSLLKEGDSVAELEESEQRVSAQRPYLSASGGAFLLVGIVCTFYPFCDIFAIIGWDMAPCFLVLAFGSIFVTTCLYCVLVGLCWLCTRIFGSALLIAVAFIGMALFPAGNPLFLTIWFLLSAAVIYFYFFYAARLFNEKRPAWLQTLDISPKTDGGKSKSSV